MSVIIGKKCEFCMLTFNKFSNYIKHLNLIHPNKNWYKCIDLKCNYKASKIKHLLRHDIRNHLSNYLFNNSNDINTIIENVEQNNSLCDNDELNNNYDNVDDNNSYNSNFDERNDIYENVDDNNIFNSNENMNDEYTNLFTEISEGFNTLLSEFIFDIQEKHLLPNSVQTSLVTKSKIIVDYVSKSYKKIMLAGLCQLNINYLESKILTKLFNYDFNKEFALLNTNYKIEKYLKCNLNYIEPISYRFDNTSKHHTFHYVSIIDTLSQFLKHPNIQNKLILTPNRNVDFYSDVYNGNKWIHETTSSYCHINLQFYIDEFSISNPLGSSRSQYKITAVYFIMLNLPLTIRFKRENICLCLLSRYNILKLYSSGYDLLFKPLINELKLLNNGISIILKNGNNFNYKAYMLFISSDNLSANDIGGFRLSFNSGNFCRFCLIHYDNFRDELKSTSLKIRSISEYSQHLSENSFGIRAKCSLLDVPNFNITTSLPPDIMHDLLEGVIPLTVYKVLKSLYNDKIITISSLNYNLKNLEFPTSCNIPVVFENTFFSKKGKIIGTASQKLELFYILPMLVNIDLNNNKAWQIYLMLRECWDYIYSNKIKTIDLKYLEEIIESYLMNYANYFGKESLIPKHHFMLHYCYFIKLYGPLRNIYCMHFERKHQYFKRLQRSTLNFINVTHTHSFRHQVNFAKNINNTEFNDISIDNNNIRKIPIEKIAIELLDKISEKFNTTIDKFINISKMIIINGIEYNTDESIIYILEIHKVLMIPIFFKVRYIILFNDKYFLCGNIFIPKVFDLNRYAYQLEFIDEWYILEPGQILDTYSHRIYKNINNWYGYSLFNILHYPDMSYFSDNENEYIYHDLLPSSTTQASSIGNISLNQDVYGYRLIYNIINNLFY